MSRTLFVYQIYKGKKTQITQWKSLPECVLNWFADTFNEKLSDQEYHPLDLKQEEFCRFVDACANCRPYNQDYFSPIQSFFESKYNSELEISSAEYYTQIFKDVYKIIKRKLDNNLFWCIKDDKPGETEKRRGLFRGKVVSIDKDSTDSGFGKMNRLEHNATYYVWVTVNIYGFPVYIDSRLKIDIRDDICMQNDCQRISSKLMTSIVEKNKGRKLNVPVSYQWNNERMWGLYIFNKSDVIKQLDLINS